MRYSVYRQQILLSLHEAQQQGINECGNVVTVQPPIRRDLPLASKEKEDLQRLQGLNIGGWVPSPDGQYGQILQGADVCLF